ncbi:MAG TPA: cation:dicarboxylase symporter family transporter [Steroidobacteraceae bacterium]|nr:cation:dicarboxylase symporter family transporter [Steroidobacteraceae bacterium]
MATGPSSSRHWWVLAALAAGIAAGAWIDHAGGPTTHRAASMIEGLGTLWLNALRMTVGPLVFSMLVAAVASVADAMATGRLATRAIGWFVSLLLVAGVFAVVLSQGLLALWPVDRAAAEAFLAGVGSGATDAVPATNWSEWAAQLLPPNIVAAAADNAILALVVFAILFGFAATRLPEPQRLALTTFFTAMAEAMVVIVHWVLLVAPIGVFALALGVGRQAGVGAAGLLLQYAVTVTLVIALASLAIYVVVALRGRIGVRRFALELAPVQVVAASTQSSLATLPAMIECARERLAVPARTAGLVLPLAVAVFRYTSPLGNLGVCFFIAAMYGIEPSLWQTAGAVFVAFAVSVGAVGLPGQVSFIASVAPLCAALGLPIEVLGILVAVEIIPDIFRTIGNVTADVAVTVLVDESNHRPPARRT